jgi:hypothetical protein
VSLGSHALARVTKQGLGFVEANLAGSGPASSAVSTAIISDQCRRSKPRSTRSAAGSESGDQWPWYHRTSDYNTLADVKVNGYQSRIFAALSIPKWDKTERASAIGDLDLRLLGSG